MKDFYSDDEMNQLQGSSGGGDFLTDDQMNQLQNPSAAPSSPVPTSIFGQGFDNFSTGVAKGELSTLKGLGTIGQYALDNTVGRFFKSNKPGSDIYRSGTQSSNNANDLLTPQTTGENVGYGAEKLGEFLLPGGLAAKGEKAVDAASQAISNPYLSSAARIFGKSAVQGTAAGAVKFLQTGDLKQSAETAATAGLTRGGMAVIGEGARAIKLPEKLYSTVFKNTASDMMKELKSQTVLDMSKTDPELYQSLVDRGIIKVGANGPVVNETLAKQALDKGLKGSIRTMASAVIKGTLTSEAKVQDVASTYKGTLDFSEPQFRNILLKIGQQYEDVGFGEISDEANRLANAIKNGNGQVDAETGIAIKRLLDKARIASSFDRPVTSLSLGQGNLKTLADTARSRVNAIPGMGAVMKEYSFNIDAMQTLAKEAARRGNNQAVSLIDSLFLSSAFGHPEAAGLGALRKLLNSGAGATRVGQMLNNPNLGTAGSTALQAGSSYLTNSLGGQ